MFPLYKKEQERRFRAFPSDSNPAYFIIPRMYRSVSKIIILKFLSVLTHTYGFQF